MCRGLVKVGRVVAVGHLVLLVPIQASAGEGIRVDYDSWADRLSDFMASRNSAEYTVTARAGQQLQWQVNGGPGELQSTPSPEQFPLLIKKKAGDGTQGFAARLQHVLVHPRPSLQLTKDDKVHLCDRANEYASFVASRDEFAEDAKQEANKLRDKILQESLVCMGFPNAWPEFHGTMLARDERGGVSCSCCFAQPVHSRTPEHLAPARFMSQGIHTHITAPGKASHCLLALSAEYTARSHRHACRQSRKANFRKYYIIVQAPEFWIPFPRCLNVT